MIKNFKAEIAQYKETIRNGGLAHPAITDVDKRSTSPSPTPALNIGKNGALSSQGRLMDDDDDDDDNDGLHTEEDMADVVPEGTSTAGGAKSTSSVRRGPTKFVKGEEIAALDKKDKKKSGGEKGGKKEDSKKDDGKKGKGSEKNDKKDKKDDKKDAKKKDDKSSAAAGKNKDKKNK